MAKHKKDTAKNRLVFRRFHYVRPGTVLNEYQFHWISTKYQLVDILTKVGSHSIFKSLCKILLHDNNTSNQFVSHTGGVML